MATITVYRASGKAVEAEYVRTERVGVRERYGYRQQRTASAILVRLPNGREIWTDADGREWRHCPAAV